MAFSMALSSGDWAALWLSVRLATTTTLILLIIGIPVAWALARSHSWWKSPVNAMIALPLVLPPSVLGFYLLIAMSPSGFIGQITQALGLGSLAFSFWGLVVASVIYSLPFVVQPIQNALETIGERPLEVAATLGLSPWRRFFLVALPLARAGIVTAAVLGFAHTLGEFGVVLMIGGNIPGTTQVVSVQVYEHVESLQYAQAHTLSLLLVGFSFIVLALLYTFNRHARFRLG